MLNSLIYNPTNQSNLLVQPDQCSATRQETTTVSHAIVKMLEMMGVQYAFGVSGGAIAPRWRHAHLNERKKKFSFD